MERWVGKVAVVTGASAGIGKAIAIDLVKAGLIVVGLSRRKEIVEALKETLKGEKGELHALACDVSSEKSVNEVFATIVKNLGRVNILVNNAGCQKDTTILGPSSSMEKLKAIIDTNINGVLYCTRAVDEILMKTGEEGYIVNIGSIASHIIPFVPPPINKINVYAGTKHALKAINEVLRQELITRNKKVRVSMICPGAVRTEIFEAAGITGVEEIFKVALNPEDISQACLFVLSTPPHVQVHDMIVKPVGEPF